jgi:hypothetical protein
MGESSGEFYGNVQMNAHANPTPSIPDPPGSNPRRLFLYESGWRIALKAGTDREFCFMTAPGQDYYHRLLDGEIYLARGDEKLCLACAERRGLLSVEPRTLSELARIPGPPDFDATEALPQPPG